ncbi:leucyl aminopeptidase [Halobacillus yeomjeoni]|uniref:leucyl aminopeptidase n=1 Tax=Halobacillus yeomjeoni TaxID=311194 RepID=UPI001CD4424D|nr:leucyl aminopeptidase [Halobacillus yeomjeoni]MCA0984504.1 leucyl aminopeptidase [Halobacillus yeomjeoni]
MFEIRENVIHKGETVLIGLFNEDVENQKDFYRLNNQMDGQLKVYIDEGDISSGYKVVSKFLPLKEDGPKRIYVLGLGAKAEITKDKYRKALGYAFKKILSDKVDLLTVAFESMVSDEVAYETAAEILAEALVSSTYQLPTFKTDQKDPVEFEKVTLATDQDEESLEYSLNKGLSLGNGVNTARYLTHLPANVLTSTEMAEFAKTLAEDYGFEIDILEKEDMERLGMGALLAVNQGSTEPPKLIVLKYQGLEKWEDVTALVGKGITYDTGGYSIKPKTGMPGMKGDMGGAAAVLGAMDTIGQLQPKKNVIAVIPSTDNMISGDAFKPDDVITSMCGKTIEVLNTDAEGRLALGDGITYAKSQKIDRVLNVATLTGGVVTALGSWMTGAMTNDQQFFTDVQKIGEEVGEPIWLLPYNDDYKAQVRKSDIADLNNSPTRKAHAIMGGAFVGEFVGDTPWIHLDIAGTSIADGAHDLGPKGPTGVMAKTLASYVMK